MKRKIFVIVLLIVFLMMTATTAFADGLPPCNDSGDPGNSDYAKHHIAFLAKAGSLGAGGHVPGAHQGFSVCLGVH